jgi:glycosyltransferase involved in cell wall biosynthesis
MTMFSVIVPARNEECDLPRTIDALLAQERASLEVIVVDDGSTDSTTEVVRSRRSDLRLRLLETAGGVGAATARNLGIDHAYGEVVVFVDADVVVPPDFLARLEELYAGGADCVSVESRVPSRRTAISRFQQATHVDSYGGLKNVGYSQAFSCRRERALSTRFPDGMPGCGGEDGAFFERLIAAGCRHELAPHVVVDHYVPDQLRAFVRQWIGRGVSSAYVDRTLRVLPAHTTATRRAAAGIRDISRGLCLVLPLAAAVRRSRYSPRGARDVVVFACLYAVVAVARGTGELRGAVRVLLERK